MVPMDRTRTGSAPTAEDRPMVLRRHLIKCINGGIDAKRVAHGAAVLRPVSQPGQPWNGRSMSSSSSVDVAASALRFVRRIGASPEERGSASNCTCPDIFELSDGRFAVIGTDLTDELDAVLPPDAGRAAYERIVVITRETLVRARADIPTG
jgi:hypothetical protein